MQPIRIFVCIIILVVFVVASTHLIDDDDDDASDDEIAQTWNSFRSSLSDPASFIGSESIQLALLLDDPRFFRIPIRGKPLLHQILNIYWLSRDNKVKQSIVDLLLICIRKGADPDEIAIGEPDALTKSILIRELRVAAALTAHSESPVYADGKKYWELFSLTCNPTPLTKLLLHANTIAYRQYMQSHGHQQVTTTTVSSELEKGLRQLLSSAFLDGQSPVVKIQDLDAISTSYHAMIARISNSTANEILAVHRFGHEGTQADMKAELQKDILSEVTLAEVTESVGYAVNIVQDAMLKQRTNSPLAVATALVSLL